MADMASELEAAAVRLRNAGSDDLVRELTAAMRRAVQPVPGKIEAGLKPHLPDPYAETLGADLDIRTIARAGSVSTDAVVSVYATTRSGKARKLKPLDAGGLHHPLFGRRGKGEWFRQVVEPGWFTGPAGDAAPQVLAELEKARDDISAKAEGRAP